MVLGRLRHGLLEAALRSAFGLDTAEGTARAGAVAVAGPGRLWGRGEPRRLTPEHVASLLPQLLAAAAADGEMEAAGVSAQAAEAALSECVPAVWALCAKAVSAPHGRHASPGPKSTMQFVDAASSTAPRRRGGGGGGGVAAGDFDATDRARALGEAPATAVRAVLGTEQAVCSPQWGLAGVIDAVVAIDPSAVEGPGRRDSQAGQLQLAPLELKTGGAPAKDVVRPAHRAQAAMYSLMLSRGAPGTPPRGAAARHPPAEPVAAVLYLRPAAKGEPPRCSEHAMPRGWPETRGLVWARNALAAALWKARPVQPGPAAGASAGAAPAPGSEGDDGQQLSDTGWLGRLPPLPPAEADDGLCSNCFMRGPCGAFSAAEAAAEAARLESPADIEDVGAQCAAGMLKAGAADSSLALRGEARPDAAASAVRAAVGRRPRPGPRAATLARLAAGVGREAAAYLAKWGWLVDTEAATAQVRECGPDPPWVAAARESPEGAFPFRLVACRSAAAEDVARGGSGGGASGFAAVLEPGEDVGAPRQAAAASAGQAAAPQPPGHTARRRELALSAGVQAGDWVALSLRVGGVCAWQAGRGRVVEASADRVELWLLEDVGAAARVALAASGQWPDADADVGVVEARVDRAPVSSSTRLARRNVVQLLDETEPEASAEPTPRGPGSVRSDGAVRRGDAATGVSPPAAGAGSPPLRPGPLARRRRLRSVLLGGAAPAFDDPAPVLRLLGWPPLPVGGAPGQSDGVAALATSSRSAPASLRHAAPGAPNGTSAGAAQAGRTGTAGLPHEAAAAAAGQPPQRGSGDAPSSEELSELRRDGEKLNEEQRLATVTLLCARDFSVLQGMPGTGKTTVLALAIRTAAAMGRRVLLTAFTHSAVDNAVLKAAPFLLRHGHGVLRLGAARSVHPDVVRLGVAASAAGHARQLDDERSSSSSSSSNSGKCSSSSSNNA
uniref:DNA2/NAM7 helicase helicase domain-containing protein n=1 Tax=Cafeteria roenbergensis TaxID=33653 RepID=A0A7S0PGC3_CAFRO